MKTYILRRPPPPPEIRVGVITNVLHNILKNYTIYLEGGLEFECDQAFYNTHGPMAGRVLVQTPDGNCFVLSKEALDADWEEWHDPNQPDLLAPMVHTAH